MRCSPGRGERPSAPCRGSVRRSPDTASAGRRARRRRRRPAADSHREPSARSPGPRPRLVHEEGRWLGLALLPAEPIITWTTAPSWYAGKTSAARPLAEATAPAKGDAQGTDGDLTTAMSLALGLAPPPPGQARSPPDVACRGVVGALHHRVDAARDELVMRPGPPLVEMSHGDFLSGLSPTRRCPMSRSIRPRIGRNIRHLSDFDRPGSLSTRHQRRPFPRQTAPGAAGGSATNSTWVDRLT